MRVKPHRLPLFLLPLLALCGASEASRAEAVAAAQGWGMPELMQSLQQVKSASGQFVERKFMHVLNEPLVASGTLLYVAPDQVQKITVSPKWERLTLAGDRLTIEGAAGEQSRRLSLSRYPEVGAFVEGIRATLAGDLAGLRRFYDVSLAGDPWQWQLRLVPKDPKLRKLVTSIRISGGGNAIREVMTEEGDGDHSDMSIVENPR